MTNSTKPRSTTAKRVTAIVAGAAALVGATFAVNAVAENKTVQHLTTAVASPSSYAPVWKAGWGGRHHRGERFANMSEAEIEKFVTRAVRHVSIEVDATPQQETQIIALVTKQAKELQPVRKRFREAGRKMHDLLLAETIDRSAIETLRAERIADADSISKGVADTIASVAEVLTPKQRVQLEERMKEFRGYRRWHR